MENLKTLTLAALIIGTPALAMASISVGDSVGTDEAEIRAMVEAQGYTVQEIEIEDGEIEVEVLLNGVETELVVDMTTGTSSPSAYAASQPEAWTTPLSSMTAVAVIVLPYLAWLKMGGGSICREFIAE